MRRARVPLATLLVLVLAGCVSAHESYPSLARRPEERVSGSATPAPPSPEAQPSAAAPVADLAGRVDQLLARARTAHHAFASGSAAAERAAVRAGALGSDSWASASIAVAGLEAQLDTATDALAELDTLAVDHRVALAGAADPADDTIAAAQAEVAGYVEADGGTLARWSDRLGG